jgi:excisionase family DNA binding protein
MTTQIALPPLDTWNARNLLTVLEVAEWARVHPKTVYRWIKDGKLEAIQFGPRTFRIPEDAIGQFLNKNGYSKSGVGRKANG